MTEMITGGVSRMEDITSFRGVYAFLSNFYPCRIVGSGAMIYQSAEAAFQAGKTDNLAERMWIATAPSPKEAKNRGRHVTLRSDWTERRHFVMTAVLAAKFSDPASARALVATRDAVLVEGNTWHDNFWGDCRCGRPSCATPGENHLGKTLMSLREVLR